MSNSEVSLTAEGDLRLIFDKTNGDVTIVTSNGNRIIFNERSNEMIINDIYSNSIRMAQEGITISSVKNISIHSDEKVSISGNLGVDIQATSGDVRVKAMNITENADIQYSAKGSATAEVQGGGELTLKGAMVMIN